jgi:hypothetical protein
MSHKQPSLRTPSYSIFVLFVACAFLLASCGGKAPIISAPSPTPAASPTPVAGLATAVPTSLSSPVPLVFTATPELPTDTPVPPSATPLLAQDTPTSVVVDTTLLNPAVVPTIAPPAPTLAPSSTGAFALTTGTTAGVLQGTVQAGQVLSYTVGAAQAQPMTLIMNSPNNDVTLGVLDPNGNVLLGTNNRQRSWQMVLPTSGQYTLQVVGGASSETFDLTIKIPVVVSFPSGTSSTTLTGTTISGYLFSYALNCAAGQTLTATLAQPASTATIDIYGILSGTLVDASAGFNSWSGTLPETEDYVVEVVPANSQVIDYSLAVSCTGTPGSSYNQTSPTSSSTSGAGSFFFRPGETMAVVQGSIQPGQIVTYSVNASQYQPLMLVLGDPNDDLALGVLDPNGNRLLDPANMYTYWQWQLPMTGTYTIQVVGGLTTENFTLTTKIGKLYTYPADGKSINIYATTLKGLIKSYAFRLSAGVVMTVKLNVPASTAYLDVFGVQTGALLNASDKATSWTGTMPSTQEYVVEVIPGNTISAYTLTISNP